MSQERVTPEMVWKFLMEMSKELDKRFKETDKQFRKTDKKIKETQEEIRKLEKLFYHSMGETN